MVTTFLTLKKYKCNRCLLSGFHKQEIPTCIYHKSHIQINRYCRNIWDGLNLKVLVYIYFLCREAHKMKGIQVAKRQKLDKWHFMRSHLMIILTGALLDIKPGFWSWVISINYIYNACQHNTYWNKQPTLLNKLLWLKWDFQLYWIYICIIRAYR